jgi:hypothetical protein
MTSTDDPFERAVEREDRLRRRAADFDSPGGIARTALKIYVAMAIGWAVLLAGHWLLFADPRWLVVLHTVAYATVVGYWMFGVAAVAWMRRERPDLFGS